VFDSYGLNEQCLELYRTLLQRPDLGRSARLQDLADYLGRTEGDTARDLEALRELGLLVPSWIEGWEYPLDPSVAFERFAARRQREIDDLSDALRSEQLAMGQFISDYANFAVQKSARDIEVLEGRERANQRMQRFRPTKSGWGLITADAATAFDPDNFPDRLHLERGVELRYIYPESFWKKRAAQDLIEFLFQLGGKIRIVPSTPFRLILFDGESAVMAIDPDDTNAGAVVHHSPAVVRLAEELFLSLWNRGVNPFDAQEQAREGGITAQEAEFLRLLVRGATDEQVARKLGVSMRTVRRMAAKLSEQVGASGRFELEVRAAQRGWVD
jgi:DNA-binding CsgD family transcriptional regulator